MTYQTKKQLRERIAELEEARESVTYGRGGLTAAEALQAFREERDEARRQLRQTLDGLLDLVPALDVLAADFEEYVRSGYFGELVEVHRIDPELVARLAERKRQTVKDGMDDLAIGALESITFGQEAE